MDNKSFCIFVLVATIAAQAISFVAADDAPLQAAPGPTHKVYLVGDCKGWCPNFDYKAWVTGKDFYMGDQLVFNYTKGQHNVIKVDEAALKQCNLPADPNEAMESGYDVVTLTAMGGIGFTSGVGKDCESGMKLFLPNVKCPHTRPKPLQAGRKLIPSD
ncbi:hypothetical protein R6Q57_007888 [Mikania cordata]